MFAKRKLRLRCVQREEPGKTQGEDSHLKAKDRGLRRHQPCPPVGLRLLAPQTVRKHISLVEAIRFVVICYSSSRKLEHNSVFYRERVGRKPWNKTVLNVQELIYEQVGSYVIRDSYSLFQCTARYTGFWL